MITALFQTENEKLSMFEDENGIVYDASCLNEYLVSEINNLKLSDSIIPHIEALLTEGYKVSRKSEYYDLDIWVVHNSEKEPVIQITLNEGVRAELIESVEIERMLMEMMNVASLNNIKTITFYEPAIGAETTVEINDIICAEKLPDGGYKIVNTDQIWFIFSKVTKINNKARSIVVNSRNRSLSPLILNERQVYL